MSKERHENLVNGDVAKLRLITINGNSYKNVQTITGVDIYYLDPTNQSEENPDGRRLIETITDVSNDSEGHYSIEVELDHPTYVIGNYLDVWNWSIEDGCEIADTHRFSLGCSRWFSTDSPLIYDYSFAFRPNKIKKGSKRYLIVEITPIVPTGSDLIKYYAALVATGDLTITIEQACGDCLPAEKDLRQIFTDEPVTKKDGCYSYFWFDTTDLATGIYDVSFTLTIADNIYVSETNQLQIY